jgi:hypothetical protein
MWLAKSVTWCRMKAASRSVGRAPPATALEAPAMNYWKQAFWIWKSRSSLPFT